MVDRSSSREKRTERLQMMLSDVELKIIDAWRFERKMPTRAAALRALIKMGLEAEGIDISETADAVAETAPVPKSDSVGVV